jgi:hypothetical protein
MVFLRIFQRLRIHFYNSIVAKHYYHLTITAIALMISILLQDARCNFYYKMMESTNDPISQLAQVSKLLQRDLSNS